MRRFASCLASTTVALAALAWSAPAFACGGTFCDGGGGPSGPPTTTAAMPIDQRGENILFVLDGKSVEAHIQIQYQGDAPHFAWMIPVRGIPSFAIGSQALFDRLLKSTVPTYGYQASSVCPLKGASPGGGVGAGGGGSGTAAEVLFEAAVGAYQVSIVNGKSGDEVQSWLTNNGYTTSPEGPALFQQYLQEGYHFAALKLQNGVGVEQIHPIVIKVPGDKPCVPLRLTRVAAVEDMTVRTFFLGNGRAMPINYKHVVLNPLRLNWLQFANNYDEVVARAVDAPVADGHAFVTEYAGPSSIAAMPKPTWDASKFESLQPTAVVEELRAQGLAVCVPKVCAGLPTSCPVTCRWAHPLVESIVHQFIPPPAGLSEPEFYSNLSKYQVHIDSSAWDGAAFAGAIDERIVLPAKHAASILDAHPYLTRMVTRISPAEMTEDPEFSLRVGQPNVPTPTFYAIGQNECSSCPLLNVPDSGGITRAVPVPGGWPAWTDEMPYAERIEDTSGAGAPVVLVNGFQKIGQLVATRQGEYGCGASSSSSPGVPGGPGGRSGTGGYGHTTPGGAGGAQLYASDPPPTEWDFGCGCAVPGASRHLSGWFLVAVGLGAFAERRRRQTARGRWGWLALAFGATAVACAGGSDTGASTSGGTFSYGGTPGAAAGRGGGSAGKASGGGAGFATAGGSSAAGAGGGVGSAGKGGAFGGAGKGGGSSGGGGALGASGKAGSAGSAAGSGGSAAGAGAAGSAGSAAGTAGVGGSSGNAGASGGGAAGGAGAGGDASAGGDAGAAGAAQDKCVGLDASKPVTLFQSSDDSNSMASPVLVRREIQRGLPVRAALVRPYEFLNYYSFDYQPADPGHVRVVPELRQRADGALSLQVAIQAPAPVKPRRSMNLTLVLDTSGSMDQDGRMDRQRAVLKAIASQLAAGDKVSLLTWSDEQTVMLDSLAVTGPDDPELLANLAALQINGGSNLNAGLQKGYEIALANYELTRMNRVVVISDGEANVGVTNGDTIGNASHAADEEGIYLVGVNVGAESGDKLMNIVTDKGRGASLFIDTVAEAEKMFGPRFDETMEIAARSVRLELTIPWYLQLESFSGEQSSTNAAAVDPQHLAPGDAMVFNEVFEACNKALIQPTDVLVAKATWETPLLHAKRADQVSFTLGELLAAPAPHLAKGTAIFHYAMLLRNVGSVSVTQTKSEIGKVIDEVDAAGAGGDADLAEIHQLLVTLDTSLIGK